MNILLWSRQYSYGIKPCASFAGLLLLVGASNAEPYRHEDPIDVNNPFASEQNTADSSKDMNMAFDAMMEDSWEGKIGTRTLEAKRARNARAQERSERLTRSIVREQESLERLQAENRQLRKIRDEFRELTK